MRKKILIWGDSPYCGTGFGNVSKNLFCSLHEHVDVHFLGINTRGLDVYDPKIWRIFPTGDGDLFGFKALKQILTTQKYDLIIFFQDIFHIQVVMERYKEELKDTPLILYYPTDSEPFSLSWSNVIKSPNVVKHFIYTEFSKNSIFETIPDADESKFEILLHGVDISKFKYLPYDEMVKWRETYELMDRFVLVNINRFSHRKFVTGTLLAVSLLRHGYYKCQCGSYYLKRCTLNRCTSAPLGYVEPKDDVCLILHMNPQEPYAMGMTMGDSLYNHAYNTGWVDDDITTRGLILKTTDPIIYNKKKYEEEDLSILYNVSNINISSTLGEGCGLSFLEAAACGTPSIAPLNSAIPEMLGEFGHLVPNSAFISSMQRVGYLDPVVSIPRMVDVLEQEYALFKQSGKQKIMNNAIVERIYSQFLWDDKREQIVRAVLENI